MIERIKYVGAMIGLVLIFFAICIVLRRPSQPRKDTTFGEMDY
jgi:hypothetical protein